MASPGLYVLNTINHGLIGDNETHIQRVFHMNGWWDYISLPPIIYLMIFTCCWLYSNYIPIQYPMISNSQFKMVNGRSQKKYGMVRDIMGYLGISWNIFPWSGSTGFHYSFFSIKYIYIYPIIYPIIYPLYPITYPIIFPLLYIPLLYIPLNIPLNLNKTLYFNYIFKMLKPVPVL